MENVRAYGKFIKKDGFIYRTDTYLQFGESKNILGACVLCNPGSSSLLDELKEKKLVNYVGENKYEIKGRLKLDPTMDQIKQILIKAYDNKIEGRVKIFNLFTIRNSKMSEAISMLDNKELDKALLFQDFLKYKDYHKDKEIPHTLIGWGCDNFNALKGEKKKWLHFIQDNNITYLGIKGITSPHYYHPLPN